ncbi:polysaccharide pyruvyl transferase CsaB [Desulfofundulus thermobenzoicus]|uniref:Polysaccharide pyruvyl transferase CsaB n=1 Tax=Desulfofundulus thermobenzoicus TaxID=29376 RepID=A0A6N7INQ3_9FIRM|nr:polysaccharide pyruvyl transferase CsaB [Desulfofundulus thermobenzoicus]
MDTNRPPRVVVSGYYGFRNLGDEAVLLAMLEAFKSQWAQRRTGRRDGTLQVVVLSNDSGQTRRLYGVEAVNRWHIKEIYRVLREADLLISGGGSLLQDVTGIKSLLYYLGVMWLAVQLKKPVVFYAQGIGPVRTVLGRFLVRRVANRARLIIVRDEQSARDLARMGVNGPPVHVTVDAALGLCGEKIDGGRGAEILRQFGISTGGRNGEGCPGTFAAGAVEGPEADHAPEIRNNRYSCAKDASRSVTGTGQLFPTSHLPHPTSQIAGISVRNWPGFTDRKKRAVARVADGLVRQGWQVVFLPFHYPADVAVGRDIAARMEKPAPVLERDFTVEEMISVIRCLDLLIGMRLHALILAAILNVPLVGISYDPKIDRFLQQLGLRPAARVGDLDFGKLDGAVEEILKDPEGFKKELGEKIKPLQKLAHRSAVLALDVLEEFRNSTC